MRIHSATQLASFSVRETTISLVLQHKRNIGGASVPSPNLEIFQRNLVTQITDIYSFIVSLRKEFFRDYCLKLL
jgi:hypothetical protein